MLIHQIARKHLSKAVYCKGGDGGAGAQASATKKGIELQREMWQTNMQNLARAINSSGSKLGSQSVLRFRPVQAISQPGQISEPQRR